MERGNDVRAVREIEGWEDKQAEGRRENERQCVLKKYLPCFLLLSYGVKTHSVSGCIWFTLAPCVLLKHAWCLYSASMIAKAGLAVFTKSGAAPKLIACDLRYTLCANIKTFNQFHLKLPMRCHDTHLCAHLLWIIAYMCAYTQKSS